MGRRSWHGVLVSLGLAIGCTPIPAQLKTKPPSALPPGAVPPGAPQVPWGKKSHAERMEFMGLYFFPKVRALFQAHDPAGNAQFRCQTCHGNDMEAANFAMPHGLYALPKADPVAAAEAYDAKTTAFMKDEVVPLARTLLGMGGVGEEEGPSCHLCHEAE